jgi:DNA repair exonuclease SbcCD ATPase subunit
LKDPALVQIAEALLRTQTLQWLNLSETLMTDVSANRFAQVITENSALQYLFFDSNKITDASGVALARAIGRNTTLVHVSLKDNEMMDESAQALRAALDQNNILMSLDVDFNDFSAREHVQLMIAIEAHKKFLTENFADVAGRHIEILQQDENRLFEIRSRVHATTETVSEYVKEKAEKEEYLETLMRTREIQIAELTARIEQLKQKSNEVSEMRSRVLTEFSAVKGEVESAQAEALSVYQTVATQRQHTMSRLRRAENKKAEAEAKTHHVLDDLKVHLSTIKEQLKQTIQDAHYVQADLLQADAEEKAKEEALMRAQELLKVGKTKSAKGAALMAATLDRKIRATIPEEPAPMKKIAAATQRPKTAAAQKRVAPV